MIRLGKQSIDRNILMICMISVLMGQFYISPSNIGFRLTLAVFFMSLFLLYFESYSVMLITMSVGISTFLFRSIVYYVGNDASFQSVAMYYLPVLAYYFFFGIFFIALDVRKHYNQPFDFFMSLWVCDTIPNVIEASIRQSWELMAFDKLVVTIAIVGMLRTAITLMVFYLGKRYVSRFKENEREKYFREIVVFLAKLKTELFLLNKSRDDIEYAVSIGHELYDNVEDEQIKGSLIHIVKEIHEIKKDYLRVIAGMDAIFKIDTQIKFMSIRDILDFVEDNLNKLAKRQNKKIVMKTNYDSIFVTHDFFTIISILNNLSVNSLDAIEGYGEIDIDVHMNGKNIIIEISDTGEGIPEEKLEIIFNAGYTTKYDKQTGKMSTGVGLNHVKELVSENIGGMIDVQSTVGKGTVFTVYLPKDRVIQEM